MMNDGTSGSASSGATSRANADTQALFSLLWDNISNAWAPVSGGRGATAAADFAANKTISLMKVLGRSMGIAGSGAGLTPRALGGWLGEEQHQLTVTEMPSHDHSITDPQHSHVIDAGANMSAGGATLGNLSITGGGTKQTNLSGTGITINSSGSNAAHNNMQPTFFCNVMIKL